MNQCRKETLEHCRRVENLLQRFEEIDANLQQMKERIIPRTSFGPANDVLRLFHLLNQQEISDQDRRHDVETFFESLQVNEEPTDIEETQEENSIQSAQPTELQVVQVVQPSVTPATPPPPSKPEEHQPATPAAPVAPAPPIAQQNKSIHDETLANHQRIIREAESYETRFRTVDKVRQGLLTSVVKNIVNKLQKDNYANLTRELLAILQGREQQLAGQVIKVSSDEERLYALARLAALILAQLLGGDLTNVKNEIFLPLVNDVSSNPRTKEFATIFLHQLYKKCPYTIPSYPERKATMTDEEYKEALGYTKKKEGDQPRLETETEFLNRMNGLIRLFCKLMISGGPPFDANLSVAWRWIADILNLPPRPQITAILIRVFLEEAGVKMLQTYGKQFAKIVEFLQSKYLPLLAKETTPDQMSRLQMTLQTWNKPR